MALLFFQTYIRQFVEQNVRIFYEYRMKRECLYYIIILKHFIPRHFYKRLYFLRKALTLN
jgi:hypothetical protein